ncbi:MAG: DUF1553 domain-containing protein [Gemmataceae bacterium]
MKWPCTGLRCSPPRIGRAASRRKRRRAAVTADPQNKLLHHQNVRRLEAEAIRDSLLSISGRLDPKMGGPGVLPHLTEHQVAAAGRLLGPLDGNGRRSIYRGCGGTS